MNMQKKATNKREKESQSRSLMELLEQSVEVASVFK
jgi:hypothetical protein